MSQELQDLKRTHDGNRFYKVDLHVHSPGSKDARWGATDAFQFLETFVARGIDLIAVTDHNSGQWVDRVRTAARVLRKKLIISTHNPNIPVLGDAELVVKVRKIPQADRCAVACAGGLEDPRVMTCLKLLEGGDEALEKRSRKYGLRVPGGSNGFSKH